jgi:hypothetical protein
MLILLPVLLMLVTALALLVLRFLRPQYKYPWMIAAGGATLALVSVFLWHIHFPQNVSLPPWQPVTLFLYVPLWVADGTSFPFALALSALAAAVIWTSVVRNESESMPWAGTLTLCALGILAVAADNPLTLVLAWSVIDFTELVIMLRSTEGETQSGSVVVAFAVRLAGTGLLLWANSASIAAGTPLVFRSIPPSVGIFLIMAAGLRLGVLPLHLPYQKENVVRRGFGTSLRLVSAAASLILLARIPAASLQSPLTPYLLILASVTALYTAWMWLRSTDEILGRPFWVLGLASLAVVASLRGSPSGSTGWGVVMVVSGGLLFLFSARQRSILWLPLLGLWGLSTLPYSMNASAWQASNHYSWLFSLPAIPAQAFLMTGFFRHCLHPGETSLESQEKWGKLIYPAGLSLLASVAILLGLWGWEGAKTIGLWWWAIIVIVLAVGFTFLAQRFIRRYFPGTVSGEWTRIFSLGRLYKVFSSLYNFFNRLSDIVTSSLEGEGGLLWSLLLLVLIISILSTSGK